jgi:hypothetical protein
LRHGITLVAGPESWLKASSTGRTPREVLQGGYLEKITILEEVSQKGGQDGGMTWPRARLVSGKYCIYI